MTSPAPSAVAFPASPRRLGDAVVPVRFATGSAAHGPLTWSQQYYLAEVEAARPHGRSLALKRLYELRPGTTEQDVTAVLATLLERHEALRSTVVPAADPEDALQRVHPEGRLDLLVRDVPEGVLRSAASQLLQELAAPVFDLAREWPVRAALVRAGGGPRLLALAFSHLAVDAFALRPVTEHLVAACAVADPVAYPATRSDHPGRGLLEQAALERSAGAARALRRAARVCAAMPPAPPDDPRDAPAGSFRFLSHRSAALDLATGAVALHSGESVATVLTAAMLTVDALMAGSTTGYVQLIAANRTRPELARAVQPCSQPVPCCVDVTDASFHDLVRRTAAATLGAFRFGSFPPAGLDRARAAAERDRGVRLDTSVTLNYRPRADPLPLRAVTGDELRRAAADRETAWTDGEYVWRATRCLSIDAGAGGLRLLLQVDTARHPRQWAERWTAAFERLLCAAARADVPAGRLSRVVRPGAVRRRLPVPK
ncbi:condensation domain-containing protein [Streptomyces sp. NPDC029519]|uniref:condensation domain-containing protein n=1 Tax=Streptomyces sp. NPDC029519 TaxID=3155364 RepID=UPI0033E7A3ED